MELPTPAALPPADRTRRWNPWPAAAIFALLFAAALVADGPVAAHVRSSGLEADVKGTWWAKVLKEPGEFRLACAAALVLVVARMDWRRALFVPVAGVMGLVNAILKWVVGRHRPYRFGLDEIQQVIPWNAVPFRTGYGIGKLTSNLSFCSGHATAAFATATALAILLPRWRWVFYAIATVTAIERVAENAHWTSDVVGGAALSYFGVHLLWTGFRKYCRPAGGESTTGISAG